MNLKKSWFLSSAIRGWREPLTSTILQTETAAARIVLLPVDALRPHEKGSPLYFQLLRQEILQDGMLKYPIIVDEKTHVILDGMHRWLAIKSLGCTLIPVMLVDVFQDSKIRVGRRRIHRYTGDTEVSIERVISAGLSGSLMKPRSTRHFFPFSKFQRVNWPLSMMKMGAPQDVTRYLSTMTNKECSLAIEEWLDEISEELEFLAKRKEEVEREKEDFLNRLRNLGKRLSAF
jgi:hypothetical protein